jgi:hypothetical protein
MAEGEMVFLEWTGQADNGARVEDGADSAVEREVDESMLVHYR